MRLQTKIILILLVLSLVPLAAIGTIAYRKGKEALRENIGASFQNIAHEIILKVDRTLYNVQQNVQLWADLDILQDVIADDVDGKISLFLMGLSREHRNYSSIFVTNRNGIVVASSRTELIGHDLREADSYEMAIGGESYVADIHFDEVDQEWIVPFASGIRSKFEDGKVVGVLTAKWNAKNLYSLTHLKEMGEEELGYVDSVLIRSDGLVISASELQKGDVFKRNLIKEGMETARMVSEKEEGYQIEEGGLNKPFLIGFDYSKGYRDYQGLGWAALVLQETETAFAGIEWLKGILIAAGVLISMLVLAVSVIVSRAMTRPILLLSQMAGRVAAGDFGVKVKYSSADEIGSLTESFNQMVGNLKKQRTQLVEKNYVDSIIANMKNSLIVTDAAGVIRTVNQATVDLLGFSDNELISESIASICMEGHKEDQILIDSLAEGQHILDLERNYRTRQGRLIPVLLTCSMIHSVNGEVQSMIFVAQDIGERKRGEEAQRRFKSIVSSSSDLIAILDRNYTYLEVNETYLDAYNKTRGDVVGHKVSEILGPEVFENKLKPKMDRCLLGEQVSFAIWLETPGRGGMYVDVHYDPFLDSDGSVVGITVNVRDITERKRAEHELSLRALQQAAVVEVSQLALGNEDLANLFNTVVALLARTLDVEYCKVLEYSHHNNVFFLRAGVGWKEGLVGHATVRGGKNSQAGYTLISSEPVIVADLRAENRFTGPSLLLDHGVVSGMSVTINGKDRPFGVLGVHTISRRKFTQDDIYFLQSVANVLGVAIERKQAEEMIEHQAYHDMLTGLPNRTLLMDRLSQALTGARWHSRMVSILFLDLDHFKRINDTLGHDMGDKLLKSVAGRLTECVREGDTVSRLGGDEFTIVLTDIARAEDIAMVGQNILDSLSRPIYLDGHEIFITASLGISLYPGDGEDADSLLKNADTAMYRAKDHGRNTVEHYLPQMNARTSERLALENKLRHALERNEFLLHYQLVVDLNTNQIVGVEALLRWKQPERGTVSPADFIPLAEETGLIIPIGEWVLRTACEQNLRWQQSGLAPIRMSVNISVRQFQDRGLLEMVSRVLRETGLEARWLDLEVTEGLMMKNAEKTIAMLFELHRRGIGISVDDFGTGYSSLSYLKHLPISTLKIDQSFVQNITSDPDDAAIVRAIVTMAHSLNLKVVAEAVETKEQLEFLRSLKCDQAQGHLFSYPLPREEITQMLSERSSRRKNVPPLKKPLPF